MIEVWNEAGKGQRGDTMWLLTILNFYQFYNSSIIFKDCFKDLFFYMLLFYSWFIICDFCLRKSHIW